MTVTSTILTCHVMQITVKISLPPCSSTWHHTGVEGTGALGVHRLPGVGQSGISSLGKRTMRLPPPPGNPREPQGTGWARKYTSHVKKLTSPGGSSPPQPQVGNRVLHICSGSFHIFSRMHPQLCGTDFVHPLAFSLLTSLS